MTEFIIDEKLAEEILAYLSAQPYLEVVDLIDGMRKLKKKE